MTIEAVLNNGSTCTEPLMQYDTNQQIHLSGVNLPASYLAEFSNTVDGTAAQISQTTATITVPDEYLLSGKPVHVWIVQVGQNERTTICEIFVPVKPRSEPEEYTPSPSEQTAIEAAISALEDTADNLTELIAPDFVQATANQAGTYVVSSDDLYELPNGHTANATWANTTKTQTTVSNEFKKLKDADTELKSAITKITGNSLIAYTSKKYIDLSGSTVTMSGGEPQFTGNNNYHNCAVVSCSADDVFTIGGKGGNDSRLWAFVDSNGNILIKASANASATGLVITAPTSAAWLILHNEVSDIRDSYVGYQIEMNNKNNNNNVKRLEDNTITSFSLTGVSNSTMLYKHSFRSGEKIYVRCTGNKCNLLGRKKSDYTSATLINNFLPSETYTEYTFTEDIEYLGLYLYDTTKTTTVYIFSGEGHALYGKVYDKIAEEKDTLNAQKVNGVVVWDEETEATETDGKLVYGALNSTISEFTYATGHYIKCAISNNPKVRVKGYGWDQSSNFALWAFTDSSNKIIARDTVNAHGVSQWLEVEVPENAAYLYVNGNQAIHAAAEVAYYSTDFSECYNAVKDAFPFMLITLGDSITKLGTSDRGWVKYFIEKTGATLVANVAVDGAQLVDKDGTTYDGNPTDSNPTNNVLGNQVQKIINNNYTAPDLIMIAVGTNNGIFITAEQIKAAYYDSNNMLVPLADVDRTTGAGAYRYCTETLHNLYPNAVIVWCAPIYSAQASRRMDQIEAWGESLEIATRYSGQMMIDTFRCGINGVGETVGSNGEYLYDGLHPNAKGAQKIGLYNASKVMPFLGNLIKSGL